MHQNRPIRVIALIDDLVVLRRITSRLGLWVPQNALHPRRAPPVAPDAWPAHANLTLTYHPVPDIA